MTRDKSLKDEPQVLLGHLEFWCFVAIFSVVGFTRISVVQLNLQTQRNHISLLAFCFPRLFLTRSYRKGFETWEASGPGWAGLQFRKSRDQTSIPLNGFPFELQQIGKLEDFLIHNSSQLPHALEIPIF